MNEHICATALYCVDSENVAPSSILFCMQTEQGLGGVYESVTNFTCSWLERTHGTSLEDGGTRRQMYGAVQMQEGRLLAFPNVL